MSENTVLSPGTNDGEDALLEAYVAEEEARLSAESALREPQREPSEAKEPEPKGDPKPEAGSDAAKGEEKPGAEPSADGEGQKPAGEAGQAPESDELPDMDAELAQLRGNEAPPAGEPENPEMPGKSIDDVAAELSTQNAQLYAAIMKSADQEQIQPFLREQLKTLGLPETAAQQIWAQGLRPVLARLHGANEAHNLAVTDQLLRSAMTPEEQAEYGKRSYVERAEDGSVKPLTSRLNAFKGVLALREQSVNKQWEEKVKSGELVTKAEAKQIREAAHAHGIGVGERRGKVASSGQTVSQSSAAATNGELTVEDSTSLSIEQLARMDL